MKAFQEHKPDDIIKQAGSAYFPAKVEKRTPGAMNLEEFKATVAQVLKTNEYEEYLEKLFTKVRHFMVDFIICFDGNRVNKGDVLKERRERLNRYGLYILHSFQFSLMLVRNI